jgi:HlyD family secretion protein
LNFHHAGRVDLLKDFNLRIPGGKVTALIGESGCGKSTLAKLLAGLYPPQSGNIRLGSYNQQDLSLECLRQQVVLVPQEPHFWSRSILDNFCFSFPEVSFEQVVAACEIVMADEFISELPDKYQTVLGEFGANLSGGQRQRLAIAREEFQRFRQLADTGAVAELQIREKEAAMQVAAARLKRMKAALNPSPAEVEKAREQIAQEQARGATAIARLNQERAQLSQQQKDLEIKLSNDRRELQQVETELQSTIIRAPISGIIQALTLRNRDQVVRVGDTIAQIAPSNANLVVKAWVPSQDIGKVAIGQPVQMRVSACPYPDYGTLSGVVQAISPDAIEQQEQPDSTALPPTAAAPKTAAYEITIQPNQRILRAKGKECPMQSGMNGQADIVSKEETLLLFIGRKARLLSSW